MLKSIDTITVVGTNLLGIHGAGQALFVKQYRGLLQGVGEGHVGYTYALPTKSTPYESLILEQIATNVNTFKEYAVANPSLIFNVLRIGCGRAGFKDTDIAPMFKDMPDNVKLPGVWKLMFDSTVARLIVAGSRTIENKTFVFSMLDKLTKKLITNPNLEIVSGLARGPDLIGKEWAESRGVKVVEFPADWDLYKKRAGYIRNQEMAWYGTHLLAFYDGISNGTKNMIGIGKSEGLVVKVVQC